MVKNIATVGASVIENMDETEKQLTLQFATSLLGVELEMIALSAEKKVLREEAKEKGVLIKNVMRIIRKMKKEMKKDNAGDVSDDERIEQMLLESEDIKDMMFKIVNKI